MFKARTQVLLVEDNTADVILLREALATDTLTSFELTTAEHLDAALELLAKRSFAVILLDLDLPNGQVLDAFSRLHQAHPHTPKLILADLMDEALALRAVQAGAQDYLVKGPAEWGSIARAIRHAIARQHTQRTLPERQILDTMREGCQIIGFDWRYLYVNAAVARQGRHTAAELLNHTVMEMFPGIEDTALFATLRYSMEERLAGRAETQFSFPDGSVRWFELSLQPAEEGLFILSVDITERKQTEAKLQASELTLKLFVEHAPAAIAMFDREMKYLAASRRFVIDYRLADQDIVGRSHYEIFPEIPERVKEIHRRCLAGATEKAEDEPFPRADGTLDWVRWEVHPWYATSGQVGGILLFSEVITERKQAAEKLRESEVRLRSVVESSPDTIFAVDQQARIKFINRVPAGMGIENVLGTSCLQYAPPEQRSMTASAIQQIFETGLPTSYEIQTRDAHDALAWHSTRLVPLQIEGQTEQVLLITEDITERKQAEAALRESEEKYRGLMESLDNVIATVDYNGKFLYMNDVAARQLGGTAQELTGKTMHELFPEPVAARQLRDVRRVMSDNRSVVVESQGVVRGQPRWYRTMVQPIHNERGRVAYVLINATDIDDLKTTQQRLLELNQTLEERVRARTAEIQDLYENAPTGYHSLDAQGNFIMVNQTELNWLGHTEAEMVGHPLAEFVTPATLALFRRNFPLFKQRGWVKDLEFEFTRKDGTIMPALVSATAIYDAEGNYVTSRSTLFDNTARKQSEDALRESEEQNRLLFEAAPDAVVLFDDSGRVVRMNHAFEIMCGYTGEQLADRTLVSMGLLSRQQAQQLNAEIAQDLQPDNVATVEFRLQQANGEIRDVGASVFGLRIRGRQHYLTTMRDITTERQAAATLQMANAELAKAARSKDEFLANMSHELRTPLTAILLFSESLLTQVRGPLNERQQAALSNIEASGRHLLDLINDVLDLSKVEAGRLDLQLEAVQVAEVCQASLLFVRDAAGQKALRLGFYLNDPLAIMMADPKRLKQMLVNLLSNAVKFTPAAGAVSLDVDVDAEAGAVHFNVLDTGIGIASEDMARLFRPFAQLDASLSRQHEGTGLGLALVQRLAELHGGSVSVESEVDKGSRFTISLPYYPSAPLPAEPPGASLPLPAPSEAAHQITVTEPQARSTPMGGRILLAEDNEFNIQAIGEYLQDRGYEVVVAHNGQEALDLAQKNATGSDSDGHPDADHGRAGSYAPAADHARIRDHTDRRVDCPGHAWRQGTLSGRWCQRIPDQARPAERPNGDHPAAVKQWLIISPTTAPPATQWLERDDEMRLRDLETGMIAVEWFPPMRLGEHRPYNVCP